jgi:hypothetical protein
MSELNNYPDREAINRRAFSLRHLVIEEIKSFLINGGHDYSQAALHALARGVTVDWVPAKKQFLIYVNGQLTHDLPDREFVFFLRGDTTAGAGRQQDLPARSLEDSDHVLTRNRANARRLIDRLLTPRRK